MTPPPSVSGLYSRPPAGPVLLGRPDRAGPGGGLRAAEGDRARRGRALAPSEPGVRAVRSAYHEAVMRRLLVVAARSRSSRSPRALRGAPRSEEAHPSGRPGRARAMLLRRVDLRVRDAARQPRNTPDTHRLCERLDESDLTLTGEAESPTCSAGHVRRVRPGERVYATDSTRTLVAAGGEPGWHALHASRAPADEFATGRGSTRLLRQDRVPARRRAHGRLSRHALR